MRVCVNSVQIMRTDETEFLPVQRRSRFILSQPTLWGQRCPDLHETRPCMDLMRCRSYHWQATDWSRCMFHRYQDECGTGYRARGMVLVLLLAASFPLAHLAVLSNPLTLTVAVWAVLELPGVGGSTPKRSFLSENRL